MVQFALDGNGGSARDPSLRLKNGSARDDAGDDFARQNSNCTTTGHCLELLRNLFAGLTVILM
jgi:hypothetical protein